MDWFTRTDIESSARRIDALVDCGIFAPENSGNPLVQSALIELVILARDLMAKAKTYAQPVEFEDDVEITERVKNVSDLIKFVRDAMCHLDSENHYFEYNRVRISRNIIYGKCNLVALEDAVLGSDYADDVCFLFGPQKLYLNRHIARACREALSALEPVMKTPPQT